MRDRTIPYVSVLMPVYNGERFLKEAIDSILGQSFSDFELVIVNDGSCDATADIIAGYDDTRLVAVSHETNKGVIAARNTALGIARGELLAMMDSDDISQPGRLACQVAYLEQHPTCGVLATRVMFIDEDGVSQGEWHDDAITFTSAQIVKFLPKANCIANSSTMLRAGLLRGRGYTCPFGITEDYDLWLRLASDGVRIAKLKEQLVYYRTTPGSLTFQSQRRPPEYQQICSKRHFVSGALRRGELRLFTWKVAASLFLDAIRLSIKRLLRCVIGQWPEDNRDQLALQLNRAPLIQSLVRFSAMIGACLPATNRSSLFFFFPFFHVGGAERVHADIVSCFEDKKPWVVFTKQSSSREFYPLFNLGASLFNLWPVCKYLYPFSVGLVAGFINRHKRPVVFGANSLFYALLVPFLKPHVRCGDLVHAFGGGVEAFTLPASTRLDYRVVINQGTQMDLIEQYAKSGLDPALAERIVLIPNRVAVPMIPPEKQWNGALQVLYVGRGAGEKRVHLIGQVAKLCKMTGLTAQFTLAGDVADQLEPDAANYCLLAGHVTDVDRLRALYAAAHLIVITSSREGLPLTIMEGMAQGCVPVCTAVGGIPEHVKHAENGWLLPDADEDVVVNALYAAVQKFSEDRQLLAQLSTAAYDYARLKFTGERFCQQYHAVLRG